MNYYERHIGDYLKDTVHLSLLEHGVYGRLLDLYYTREEPLPDAGIVRLLGARSDDEKNAVHAVLQEFFKLDEGLWRHSRCDVELERYADKRTKARASAAASVSARKLREDSSNAEIRSARMFVAREKGRHSDSEWNALVEACESKCVRCGAAGKQERDHIKPVYQGGSDSIFNIQPLCAHCNASKGPECVDHRPNGWQASVERTLGERLALQSPDTSLQTPVTIPKEEETPRKRVAPPTRPDDVSQGVWEEWKQLRQKKRATCTASVVEGARLEAQKAGLSLEEFFKVWVRRGSQGLEAAWLKPNERGVPVQSFAEQDRQAGFERWEEMTGRIHPDRKQAPRILDLLPVDQLTIGATK